MRRVCFVALLAFSAQAAGTYVGAEACRRCHASQFKSQAASAHAGALSRVSEHSELPAGKLTRGTKYRYEISGMQVRIGDGTDLMELPLEWAFGAGRQATTFVTRVNSQWYVEHYASLYRATNSYGPTPGQETLHPKAMQEAAGVLYRISDPQLGIKACFECHSTGPVAFDTNGDAKIQELGVRCESCHGPGSGHVADPAKQKLNIPVQLNDFCGRCHRPPAAKGVTIDWNYAWNVRHQPVYLSQSRCFLKSDNLSCLTCHDPHEAAAARPVAYFNDKCHQCHEGCATTSRTNCVDCHMPLVTPQAPLRFTNHWIGIYRSGAGLRPIR
jgi:hypothetical protein